MRFARVILLVLCLSSLLRAQEDSRRSKVVAATANAIDALKQEILRQPLGRRFTVKDLIDKTGSDVDLTQTLQRAEQIGGPRWLDDNTCQVRLEIDGQRVARTLMQIATVAHERTPIQADALRPRIVDIQNRRFSATGSSTGVATIEQIRPREGDPWAGVPDNLRRAAVNQARDNAIQRVLESLRGIESTPGHTLAAEIDAPKSALRQGLIDYLSNRPVTSVNFREDRQVDLSLAVAQDDLYDIIYKTMAPTIPPTDTATWNHVRDQLAHKLAPATGVGRLPESAASASPNGVQLPNRPPQWVDRQLDAEGTGRVQADALRSIRQAESQAKEKIKVQISELRLTSDQTMADALRRDRHLADAVSRAVDQAQTYKVVNNPDGSVTTRLSLDLRQLWQEINSTP